MENDLDSFLAAEANIDDQLSAQAPKPAEQRVFDEIADQERGESSASLKQSMFLAKDKNPDKQAKVLDISKKLSLPPSFVDRNFDSLSKKVDSQIDYDGMVDKNPRLTQWLSNSDNAALAKDDLAPLQDLEDTTHEYTGLSKAYHSLNGGMASLLSSLAKVPRFTYDLGQTVVNETLDDMEKNFQGTLGDIGKNMPRLPDAPEDNWGKDIAKVFDDVANYERSKIPDLGVDVIREIQAGNKSKAVNALFLQAVNSAPTSIAALVAYASGYGVLGLAGIGMASGAEKYDQNLNRQKEIAAMEAQAKAEKLKAAGVPEQQLAEGEFPAASVEGGAAPGFMELMSPDAPLQNQEQFSKNTALLNATIYGTIEAGVESISFGVFKHWEKALLKQFGKNVTREVMLAFGKTMAASTLSEGGEEVLTQAGQAYTDYLTGVDKNALKDLAAKSGNAGLVGVASGGMLSGPATITSAIAKHQQATQTNIARQYYDQMAEKINIPKLRKRSAESQAQLVQEITKDGPENVFVPIAAYERYLQSKNLSAAEFSENLGVREKYDEAVETGGDIAVPYSAWLDKLVDTEHYAGLKDDVKFDAEMLTFNQQKEEAEALKKADEQVQAETKAAEETAETQKKLDETRPIRESIEKQLIETGRASPQEAKDNAAAVEAVFRTLGEREGLNPVELFKKYGVRIEAADAASSEADLNQKRQNTDTPEFREWFGESKAVDESGAPIVAYHGTSQNIEEFNTSRMGESGADHGEVYWTTTSPQMADDFAEHSAEYGYMRGQTANYDLIEEKDAPLREREKALISELQNKPNKKRKSAIEKELNQINDQRLDLRYTGQNILPVYLQAKNPLTYDANGKFLTETQRNRVLDRAKREGNDSVLFKNLVDSPRNGTEVPADVYAVFSPTQIKSVNNRGTFDPNDPMILNQRSYSDKTKSPNFKKWSNKAPVVSPEDSMDYNFKTGKKVVVEAFHGTKANIEKFSQATLGASTNAGSAKLAHFFTNEAQTASDYAAASDGQLSLRGKATQAELTAQKDTFIAAMREKYGNKWANKLSPEEKAQRKDVNQKIKEAVELQFRETATPATLNMLEYKIEQVENKIKYFQDGAYKEFVDKRKQSLSVYKDKLENYDWVKEPNKKFNGYNLIDKKTGEKIVNPVFQERSRFKLAGSETQVGFVPAGIFVIDKETLMQVQELPGNSSGFKTKQEALSALAKSNLDDEVVYRFYDSPENIQNNIKKTEDFIKEHSEKSVQNSIKEEQAHLEELKKQKKEYLEAEGGDVVYPAYIKMNNPFVHDFEGADYRDVTYRELIQKAMKAGHDGVIFTNTYDPAFIGSMAREADLINVYAVFEPTQIKSKFNSGAFDPANPDILKQGKDGPLAEISMREGETIIRLFQGKDKSSFLHETGHLYVRVLNDLVNRPEASAELKQDFKTILDYVGAKDFAELTERDSNGKITKKAEAMQEKFAETLEAYVMRGVAPSTSLARVFHRFKNWLESIYGSIKNTYFQRYGVQITPEIKDVLDRMFATKEEISKAQNTMNYSVLPAAALGMNPEQQARYMSALDDARRNSNEVLLAKLMRDSDVKRQPEYKAKRKEVELNITADVNNSPSFKAIDLIKNSTIEKDGIELKINRDEVKKLYPEAYKLMPSGTTQVDGMPLEMVAERLNFKGAKELVDAISQAGNRSEIIEARVEAEMSELFPDLLESGELAQAALDAIHNDEWTKVMEMEWQHVVDNNPAVMKDLIRRGTRINFNDPARRKQAKLMMQQKRVTDIRPIDYQRAGAKAARDAGVALAQGDFSGFIEAKRQQLLNHELYKAALEVKTLTKKGNDLFKQIYRTKTQDAAKTRDIDYLSVQKAILAQFGIGPEQPMQADEYLEKIKNYDPVTYAMLKPIMDSSLQGAAGWQTLTVARYSQLVDDMRAMRDIGRDARQFQLAQEKIEFDKVKEETMAQNDEHGKNPQKYDHEKTRWDDFKIQVLGWKNSMKRTEAWVRVMDLGKRGPWNKYFWEPINEAFTDYMLDKAKYYQKFMKLTKEWAKSLNENDWKPIEYKLPDGVVIKFKNKLDLIAAVKHSGNASNLSKLVGGFTWGVIDENGEVDTTNWNKFINEMYKQGRITQVDMQYVQDTWNIYEELKPRAQAAHKKDTGYYFNEIKNQEIVTPFGRYKGGYVPLVYDRSANPNVARNALKNEILESNPGYEMPNVSKGMTKERVKFFSPLSLDLQQTNRDLDNVLKFINLRAPVKQAARLLYNKEFSASIHAVDPTVIENLLEPFLARAASNKVIFTDGKTKKWLNNFAGFLKASATANTMIWNFGNALQNYASLFPAQVKIDEGSLFNSLKHTRSATVTYLMNPNETAKFIAEKSKFMRTDIDEGSSEAQRELRAIALNPNRILKAADFLEANSFALMKITQRQTSNIVWLAAYNSALERGLEIDSAVRHADATVRTTQGDQRSIGVSEIETGSPWYRNFSMYTGFFNVIGNLINTEADVALKTLTPKQATARLGTIYTMAFMMLAVGGDLLIKAMRGKLDEDDDEEYLDDFIYTFFDSQVRFGTAMIPLVGPTINYSRKYFDRNINELFGVEDRPTYIDDKLSLSPAISTLESGVRGVYAGYKLLADDEEFRTRDLKDTMTLMGLVMSGASGRTIPLGGFQKPVGYLKDVATGDAEPEGPVDFTQGLITGKQSK